MSFSILSIHDSKGKILISRDYRGDIPLTSLENFLPLIRKSEEDELLEKPVISDQNLSFIYVKHQNIYLVATTKKNSNVALIFVFLHKLLQFFQFNDVDSSLNLIFLQIFQEYFKTLEEESIRDNFVIIYELFDEIVDFGYPQTTETKILKEFITQEYYKLQVDPKLPLAVTNAVSWRSEGIKYRNNEVFLDVVESVNLLINQTGEVLNCEVLGSIKMRVFLSGMPELRLGLNDRILFENSGKSGKGKMVELEDIKFHQCVRLSRFTNDRTISFIPPDGEFELMSYRLSNNMKPLIWIESIVERHERSRIEYMIRAVSQFKRKSAANNVKITIPVPSDADSPRFKCSFGTVQYTPEKNAFDWCMRQFTGGKECILRAHFSLSSFEKVENEGIPPITISFEIPYFTTSGIQVRYLKVVEKSGYQSLPWVRYLTKNGGITDPLRFLFWHPIS